MITELAVASLSRMGGLFDCIACRKLVAEVDAKHIANRISGIVTLTRLPAKMHGVAVYQAAWVTASHRFIASVRNWRKVLREIR